MQCDGSRHRMQSSQWGNLQGLELPLLFPKTKKKIFCSMYVNLLLSKDALKNNEIKCEKVKEQ